MLASVISKVSAKTVVSCSKCPSDLAPKIELAAISLM